MEPSGQVRRTEGPGCLCPSPGLEMVWWPVFGGREERAWGWTGCFLDTKSEGLGCGKDESGRLNAAQVNLSYRGTEGPSRALGGLAGTEMVAAVGDCLSHLRSREGAGGSTGFGASGACSTILTLGATAQLAGLSSPKAFSPPLGRPRALLCVDPWPCLSETVPPLVSVSLSLPCFVSSLS